MPRTSVRARFSRRVLGHVAAPTICMDHHPQGFLARYQAAKAAASASGGSGSADLQLLLDDDRPPPPATGVTRYHALIDTGALVTGLSNLEVIDQWRGTYGGSSHNSSESRSSPPRGRARPHAER